MSKNGRPPRKLTEDEVLGFIAQFATSAPQELTLTDAIRRFAERFPSMSDRLSMRQTGELLGLFGIIAKYAAAHDQAANAQIIIARETVQ